MIGSVVSVALDGASLNALLVAAIDLRLCEHLAAGPATVQQLARRASISERGCQAVADGMVALKLWRVSQGVYSNTATAEASLLPGAPQYVGDERAAFFDSWLPRLLHISESVRTGKPPSAIDSPETLEFWSILTPLLARKGRSVPRLVVSLLGLTNGAPHLLDVGGGASGLYSCALLAANPAARVTQVDHPHINEKARGELLRAGFADRFDTRDGDFHSVDFGSARYDVAILSHIVHQESRASILRLLGRIAKALRNGGRIVIVDWVVDDGRTGPASALLFNLTMLLLCEGGKSYEQGELTSILREGGFVDPTIVATEDMSKIIVAIKV
jgi:SAM-dependent methyltransferase